MSAPIVATLGGLVLAFSAVAILAHLATVLERIAHATERRLDLERARGVPDVANVTAIRPPRPVDAPRDER